ncbi:hypothetical protein L211DRAFT_31825 [Terfezia boudieri ATCC MYA-4762]|uniref:MACPF domain-containing protein n=1 Tax=Terfezia boudieri ATCC MYA-4762 TaxID=1051890 RepID=A0A3N4M7F7_9PEZI|nr:hypothetical protein L211DRAFT_31825 [Terfezia boudieri ATCC MYA-4762]
MVSPEQQRELQLLLLDAFSPKDIQLGRMVADPANPLLNFIDPDIPGQKISQTITTKVVGDVKASNRSTKKTRLCGALVKVFSSTKSTTKEHEETFQGTHMETVKLRNYPSLFEETIAQEQVRKWIEKLCETSVQSYIQMFLGFTTTVYMIIGYSTVKDLQVQVSSSKEATLSGTVDIAAAIASTTGLPDIAPVLGNAASSNITKTSSSTTIPGETIWAIAYQKIKIRTKSMEPSLVSTKGSSRWKIMLPSYRNSTDVIAGPIDNYLPVRGLAEETDNDRDDCMRIPRELIENKDREVVIVAELAPGTGHRGLARHSSQVEASLALREMQGRQIRIPHTHDGEFTISKGPEKNLSKGCECIFWFNPPEEGLGVGKQLPDSYKRKISHRRLRHLPIISQMWTPKCTGNFANRRS